MLRHPAEVVGSRDMHYLKDADAERRLARETGNLAGWVNVALTNERTSRGDRRTFVHYGEMITDWRSTMTRIAERLGLTYDADLSSGAHHEVDDFIDANLRRSQLTLEDIDVPADLRAPRPGGLGGPGRTGGRPRRRGGDGAHGRPARRVRPALHPRGRADAGPHQLGDRGHPAARAPARHQAAAGRAGPPPALRPFLDGSCDACAPRVRRSEDGRTRAGEPGSQTPGSRHPLPRGAGISDPGALRALAPAPGAAERRALRVVLRQRDARQPRGDLPPPARPARHGAPRAHLGARRPRGPPRGDRGVRRQPPGPLRGDPVARPTSRHWPPRST